MHSTVGGERKDDLAPLLPSQRQTTPQGGDARAAERLQDHRGVLRRMFDFMRDMRRRRRERKPWGPIRKGFYAMILVSGLAVVGAELIKHGHRELGEDFAVGAILLLLLLICMVGVRHFIARELEG